MNAPTTVTRPWHLALLGGAGLLAAALWWGVWQWQFQQSLEVARQHAQNRLSLYSTTLEGALARFAYLPRLLASQPRLRAAVDAPSGATLERANRYLERVAADAGAEAIFLLDRQGHTVASSNHATVDSFIGHHYGFRPYFQDALHRGEGEFFAIGSTTERAGYFISTPVISAADGQALGVVAIKVALESLQASWRRAGETVLLSDANGVVILSSRPGWRYRTLAPIGPAAMDEIRQQRQFLERPLERLGEVLADGSLVIGSGSVSERYLDLSRAQRRLGWTMHYLVPMRPLYQDARNAFLAAAGATLVLVLLGLWLRERQKRHRLRDREARIVREANEHLESRVIERTRALQEAQEELVQAGKLASLGTMAAGIAHELNQPLSGIRTYAANGARLMARGRHDAAEGNFARIQSLCDRQDALIRQLRLFARRGGSREPIDLEERLAFVLELLDERLRRQGVEVALDRDASPCPPVLGDTLRIEQLLTNLLRNALDALATVERPRLAIALVPGEESLTLRIADNGPGIDEAILSRLFDPFFTTKAVGDGLGLGLFICFGIVQDLEGRITATNLERGGACFEVTLPLAATPTSLAGDARDAD
ncbi:C4-dicarboxylate transport sensor protein DctB [Halomonas sp. THAF5a]|uniref:sensor histidine kinase n=1 Tax=Halomonas sp. THAF5a TaxID=2587844 RepID=UPI0012A9ED37|nr:ATP-binding protein [Halomonas sp. THAF5a]QFU03115.1 C4-dicarboxylate transport sensor protein DctB [Halomonas sp. THAF5a]